MSGRFLSIPVGYGAGHRPALSTRNGQNRDYPLILPGGSLYGWLRNWMGLESLSCVVYDDPAMDYYRGVHQALTGLEGVGHPAPERTKRGNAEI